MISIRGHERDESRQDALTMKRLRFVTQIVEPGPLDVAMADTMTCLSTHSPSRPVPLFVGKMNEIIGSVGVGGLG